MNPTQWFTLDETFKGFYAQREFTLCQRTFGTETTPAQTSNVFGNIVVRSINDAQVFWPTTLNCWLHKATSATHGKIVGLDNHTFTAATRQTCPPRDARFYAARIGNIHQLIRRGKQQLRISLTEHRQRIHVPLMILVTMGFPLRRQNMERSKLEIGN